MNSKNIKSIQFVNNNTQIDLFILKYFLLKNRLYNPATHRLPTKDAKNPDTIKSNGKIGFFVQAFSVRGPHIVANIMKSSPDMIAPTTIQINILPNISHQDVLFGFADNSLLFSSILINFLIKS